ncbi:MAG: hypothetical protein KAS05_02885 [Candidatus Omnitrophica bacterium]|nr:hypothetical protein [Candidatus Omnitrophota bacterium]
MDLHSLIGKLVLFKFHETIKNDFRIFDIQGENLWGVVSGIEPNNMGVWVKHPKYKLGIWWDEEGNTIPENQRTKEEFEADVLIPWQYIKGIMCIRDDRFNREDKSSMGFHPFEENK